MYKIYDFLLNSTEIFLFSLSSLALPLSIILQKNFGRGGLKPPNQSILAKPLPSLLPTPAQIYLLFVSF